MECQICGRPGASHKATLYSTIGMVVALRYHTLKGVFCSACLDHFFWEYTLITLSLGWWGLVSLFLTPMILVNNLFFFVRAKLTAQPAIHQALLASAGGVAGACPNCHSIDTAAIGPRRAVWASVAMCALLLLWAMSLIISMANHSTSGDNTVVVIIQISIVLLSGLCLTMLLRHPLRQCRQCGAAWSGA